MLSSRLPLFVYTLQLTVLYLAGAHAMYTVEDEGETNTNSLNVNDKLPNSTNLTSLLTVDIFFHVHRGGLAHFFPKVLINSWRRMGKTPILFLAPNQASLGSLHESPSSGWTKFRLRTATKASRVFSSGAERNDGDRSLREHNLVLLFIGQVLYIFLISATTLKHPKHDVELLEPRLQCSVHILDTSHHPHAGRWRCTLPCSPWRSSRKVPLPCFRSHELDRRLSSHYIHKFKHIGNLESFIWLQIARIILLDLNLHIWPL